MFEWAVRLAMRPCRMLALLEAKGVRADDAAVCGMTAVVEYICAEIIELGGNALKDDRGGDRPPLARALLDNDAIDGVVRVPFDENAQGDERPGWYDISTLSDDAEPDRYLCRRHVIAAIDKDDELRTLFAFLFKSGKRKRDAA